MRQYLNWKTYLIFAAFCIVGASLYYTSQLATKLADEERKKMEQVAEGIKIIVDNESSNQPSIELSGVPNWWAVSLDKPTHTWFCIDRWAELNAISTTIKNRNIMANCAYGKYLNWVSRYDSP